MSNRTIIFEFMFVIVCLLTINIQSIEKCNKGNLVSVMANMLNKEKERYFSQRHC